jgi:hypothetical protein
MRIAVNINIGSPFSNGVIAGGHCGPTAGSHTHIERLDARQSRRGETIVQLSDLQRQNSAGTASETPAGLSHIPPGGWIVHLHDLAFFTNRFFRTRPFR